MSRAMNGQSVKRKLTTALVVAATALMAFGNPATANSKGFIEEQVGVGFFYGTFDQSPNILLLVGGTAEQFCEANPDDPFNAEPGTATQRTFLRSDGSVDLKVNDKNQPIYLYNIDFDGGPPWIESVCADHFDGVEAPRPFASGTADLKVRLSIVSENYIDIFNSVNGRATGTDGTEYRVRGWADLIVENGQPVGDPADFVGFVLKEIGN